jgi:hypothetical protein
MTKLTANGRQATRINFEDSTADGRGFTQIGDREWTRNDGNVFGAATSRVRKPGAKGIFAALPKSSPIRPFAVSQYRAGGIRTHDLAAALGKRCSYSR